VYVFLFIFAMITRFWCEQMWKFLEIVSMVEMSLFRLGGSYCSLKNSFEEQF